MPLMMFVVLYTNYFVLVPKLFMHNRRQLFFVVEVILILVVLIGLVLIFKKQLVSLVNSLMEKVTNQSNTV